jgi:hypothetical protein
MSQERIEAYINKRLAELDKQKDMQEIIKKGSFSFGVEAETYGKLPAWKDLIKRKKQMVKTIWASAFFVSLMIVFTMGDYYDKFEQNWLKALLTLVTVSALAMLIYVINSFYNLFYHFRQTEREVRKLIYQDILQQLKKEEKEFV